MKPDTVVFDVFGTLFKCERHHHPYLQLMQWTRQNGRSPQPSDVQLFMSQVGSLQDVANRLNMPVPSDLLSGWEDELQASVRSLQRYPETLPTIDRLRQLGYRVGLCANLAQPYSASVLHQLPSLDACVFSYEVGAIKPQPEIYQALLDQLACSADQVLFVGNSTEEDVRGLRKFGMQSRFLARWQWDLDEVLRDLLSGRGMQW